MITIDGVTYDVPLGSVKRDGEFLIRSQERTMDGKTHIKGIGFQPNYNITFGLIRKPDVYAALYDALTSPVRMHDVVVPYNGVTMTLRGYFDGISDQQTVTVNGVNKWKGLTCRLTCERPTRR